MNCFRTLAVLRFRVRWKLDTGMSLHRLPPNRTLAGFMPALDSDESSSSVVRTIQRRKAVTF